MAGRARWYVGLHVGSRVAFRWAGIPVPGDGHGQYAAVIGPFKTKRAAQWCARYGANNPHMQTVNDAERIARQLVQDAKGNHGARALVDAMRDGGAR